MNQDDLKTKIVSVSGQAATASRGANTVTINPSTIFVGGQVTFTATGSRQSEPGVSHEDEKFIPLKWRLWNQQTGEKIFEYRDFTHPDNFTEVIDQLEAGRYEVEVNYYMYKYDFESGEWGQRQEDDTKRAPFNVVYPANPDNNKVNATPSSVISGGTFTLTAEGDRQSEIGDFIGNERFVPASWSSTDGESGTFAKSGAEYTSFYTPSEAGDLTLTVTFIKQTWNGSAWTNTATEDQKTVQVNAEIATTNAANNRVSADPESIVSGGTATVTVSGDRQSENGVFTGDERFVPAGWTSTDGQSDNLTPTDGSFQYSSSTRGTHTLTTTFQKQQWNSAAGEWEDVVGVIDTKTAMVKVIATASDSGNTVGVSPDRVTSGEAVTVRAEGDRQSEDGLTEGDERYIPAGWSSTDGRSGTFIRNGTEYTSEYKPTAAGAQTVTVTFQKQRWDEASGSWVNVSGDTDTKTTTVEAEAATADAANNSVSADSESVTSGGMVTVRVSGDRQTAAGLLEGDERFVPAGWASTDNQSGSLSPSDSTFDYKPSEAGAQTVTVTFQKQRWDAASGSWVNVSGDTDTKTTTVEAKAATANAANNRVGADPESIVSGGTATVTVSGDRQSENGVFTGDERFVPAGWTSTAGQSDNLTPTDGSFQYSSSTRGTHTLTTTFQKQQWNSAAGEWEDVVGVIDTKTATVKVIATASDSGNTVGVSPDRVTSGEAVTVRAEGDRQSEDGLTEGDERYIPAGWSSTDGRSGTFIRNGTEYTSEYKPTAAGAQTVTVTFQKQRWDEASGSWVNVSGDTDTKTTTVEAEAATADAANNSVSADSESVTSGGMVTVTVSGDRQTAAGLLEGDERFVPAGWASTDNQSGSLSPSDSTFDYKPSEAGAQTVTVTFQKQRWDAASGSWVNVSGDTDTKTTTVEAKAATANAANNRVSADPASITSGGTVRLLAAGDRQSADGLFEGDERFVPASWESTDGKSGSFTESGLDYLSEYAPSTTGNHTVTVTFQKQIWNGTSWLDDRTVTQTVDVKVNAPSAPSNPSSPAPETPSANGSGAQTTDVIVLVNGKVENAGTATTAKQNGRTVTIVAVDPSKLEAKLAAEGQHAVVTIPIRPDSNVVVGELNGELIKHMEQKQAVLEIRTDKASYKVPAEQIRMDAVAAQIGKDAALQEIKVQIEISEPTEETVKAAENSAVQGQFTIVAPTFNFKVRATYGNSTIEVSKFNVYVERTIAIPDKVDPNKITTGVVIEPDGSARHVPTQVTRSGASYFAKINSLTNSTYAVVWNPIEFSDVAKHWAKSAVNDMGSRMVIDGTGGGKFTPNRDITRAEFAAILVRGLGLKPESGATAFSDVKAADWYSGVINTAYAYQLIDGFQDGTFRPQDKITREQAMLILSKAMVLTGLADTLSVPSADAALKTYGDAYMVAKWAQEGVAGSIRAGIVTGRSADTLAPKANMTRAEVAAIVQRLLQKAELIEVK
ncbi:S-layer homology domain-containing protein [Cohnella hongkongensis]|uniref:S-layer homology domain-containing protein n=1 Tax=Cohnella hongkongensis TaxID=178337 RepID=A0ABV9F669_9BACL